MSAFFIDRPIVAIVIAIVTVIVGLVAMRGLPVAQFPTSCRRRSSSPRPTPAPTPSTIEQSVATPLEQQMNGVDNMLYMQSTNANDGTMQLTVTFDVETESEHRPGQRPEPRRAGAAEPAGRRQPVRPHAAQDRPACRCWSSRSTRRTNTYDCAVPRRTTRNININDALYRVPGVGQVRIFGASRLRDAHLGEAGHAGQARPHGARPGAARSSSRARSTPPARSAREPAPTGPGDHLHRARAGPAADAGGVRRRSSCAPTPTARWCG